MPQPDACPLPGDPSGDEEVVIQRLLQANRIAIVGLSDDPGRPSFGVAAALLAAGKQIIPVNPNCKHVLGHPCYPSLADVPGEIDLVNVFRRPEFCAEVAREAVSVRAKGLWLQSGIVSDEAREIAGKAGLDYVEDRCIKVELMYRGR